MARKKSKTEEKADAKLEEAELEEAEGPSQDEELAAQDEAPASDEPMKSEAAEVTEESDDEAPEVDHAGLTEPNSSAPVIVRKGGFMPMLLGGVVAAAIGAGAAIYLLPQLPESWLPETGADETAALAAKVEAQAATIKELQAVLATKAEGGAAEAALADLEGTVEALGADVAVMKPALEKAAKLDARIAALEQAPVASAAPEAVEAYRREMEALREALAAQRAEVEAMAQNAEDTRADAEMTAQEALKRSALSQILTSLETGSDYGEAISGLEGVGVTVPDALTAQADGVPTVAALSQSFAPAAREALAAARTDEGGGGFSAFLKNQLGARSLEPREGDDPDAILSRMEAAAREGRLGDVMAEADALPAAAKVPLQDWLDAARARLAAVEAAEALSQQINSN